MYLTRKIHILVNERQWTEDKRWRKRGRETEEKKDRNSGDTGTVDNG
jgi:hypothetical protein